MCQELEACVAEIEEEPQRRPRRDEIKALENRLTVVLSNLCSHLSRYPAIARECSLKPKKETSDRMENLEGNNAMPQPSDTFCQPVDDDILIEMECVRKKQQVPRFDGELRIELECVPIGKWNDVRNLDDDLQIEMECIRRMVTSSGDDIQVEIECIRIQSEKKDVVPQRTNFDNAEYFPSELLSQVMSVIQNMKKKLARWSNNESDTKPMLAPSIKAAVPCASANLVHHKKQLVPLHVSPLQKRHSASLISTDPLLPILVKDVSRDFNSNLPTKSTPLKVRSSVHEIKTGAIQQPFQEDQKRSQNRTAICPFCDRKFSSPSGMRRHSLNIHKQALPSPSSSKFRPGTQQNLTRTCKNNFRPLLSTQPVGTAHSIISTDDDSLCEIVYESLASDTDDLSKSNPSNPAYSLNSIKSKPDVLSTSESSHGLQLTTLVAKPTKNNSRQPEGFEEDVMYDLTSNDDGYEMLSSNVREIENHTAPTGIHEITAASAEKVYDLCPTGVDDLYNLCPASVKAIHKSNPTSTNNITNVHFLRTGEKFHDIQPVEDEIYAVCPVSELQAPLNTLVPDKNVSHEIDNSKTLLNNEVSMFQTRLDEDNHYPTLVTLLGDNNILSQTLDILLSGDTFLNSTWCYNPCNDSFLKELNSCLESIERNRSTLHDSAKKLMKTDEEVEN